MNTAYLDKLIAALHTLPYGEACAVRREFLRRFEEHPGRSAYLSERAAKGIDWDAQPLGLEGDSVIARRLGCSPQTVQEQRKKRGLPRARKALRKARRKKRNISELTKRRILNMCARCGVRPRSKTGQVSYCVQCNRSMTVDYIYKSKYANGEIVRAMNEASARLRSKLKKRGVI